MSSVNLVFGEKEDHEVDSSLIVGWKEGFRLENLQAQAGWLKHVDHQLVNKVFDSIKAEESYALNYIEKEKLKQIVLICMPSICSRNNCPARPDAALDLLKKNMPKRGHVELTFIVEKTEYAFALGCVVGKLFPLYNMKTSDKEKEPRVIFVNFITKENQKSIDLKRIRLASEAIRTVARLVDMPTNELHTDSYLDEIEKICSQLEDVKKLVIKGKELEEKGFGGLWSVGKAASHLPALVVLGYSPINATKTTAIVGKGIVFDTGGLCIKDRQGMITMKADMTGSAIVLAVFEALVKLGYNQNLHAILCLAENSVGSESTRPDDVIRLYSGKTVEVNNTDAEGRIVLGDGVAYATKHLNPDVVIDMATLTGAQGIATGKNHAALLCNNLEYEQKVIKASINCGDLAFPIIYCPELLKKEFKSEIADMKNSVKDRFNAQSSCAGHFIEDHLDPAFKGIWLHIDLAAPVFQNDRATGYGVALLMEILRM